ncbi:hypothetical protein PENCOP_c012G03380 [Penicillium coprophilum]|uniref:Heterokaryon incompatibility domain-containing protein n=1 Tax=Penicillium coprophilum TaxID=36646 RepID=A0A1V6UDB8_9EURO|nr:hypothetical protein PENCOP_c012G03380 [Penicillium coprophilum]
MTETWDFLRQIISWMILETLRAKELFSKGFDVFDTHPCLKIAFEGLKQQLSDISIPESYEYLSHRTGCMDESLGPVGLSWFSSLWTLQEISLRPDMLLVNKNWEPFTIGHKTHVAMDTILYLTSMIFEKLHPVSAPPAVSWLKKLFSASGIEYDFHKNPIRLLNLGSSRHCSRSRSEAIMSVLGCVDWHRKRTAARLHVESNALASALSPNFWLYEFEFLVEVRQKYGFVFFYTKYGGHNFFMDVVDSKKPFGTILPFTGTFSPDRIIPAGATYPTTKFTGHPSVDSWTLLRDGSVKVNKVCILYQTSRTYSRRIRELNPHIFEEPCLICGPPLKIHSKNQNHSVPCQYLSLRGWMDGFSTMSPLYAVVLCYGRDGLQIIDGFILAEVPILSRLKDNVLAKLADFKLCPDFEMDSISRLPETEEVDWFIY